VCILHQLSVSLLQPRCLYTLYTGYFGVSVILIHPHLSFVPSLRLKIYTFHDFFSTLDSLLPPRPSPWSLHNYYPGHSIFKIFILALYFLPRDAMHYRRRKGSAVGGTMASAEHETITGVWRQSHQRGPGAESLVRG